MVLHHDTAIQHRIMNNLHQTLVTVVTETVAAVMAPSIMDNSNPPIPYNNIVNMPVTNTSHSANNNSITSRNSSSENIIIANSSSILPTIATSHHNLSQPHPTGHIYWGSDGGGGSSSSLGSIGFGMGDEFSPDGFDPGFGYDTDNSTYFYHNYNGTDYPFHCQDRDPLSNLSYWNLTCDTPVEYVVPLYGYCMPFLLIVTVLSNSFIVLILSKKNMSTPTNFVLMVMAICDMLTVIFPAPGHWYMYSFGNHYKPLHPVSLCWAYTIFNEIMPAMCHTASIWLTLGLAVQRYIYVCHAPMARTWCTMPRVKRFTIYITFAAFLHQSTRIFDRSYEPLTIEWNGQMVEVCHIGNARWVQEIVGEDYYYTFFFVFRVLFVHLLPCIILVTLNILLLRAMRQAKERRKLLISENRKKECKKLRESNCTTLMLIVVVTVFLTTEIPIAVVTVMHIVSSLTNNFLDYEVANIFITFTNFFLVASYPINFGIYCGMSRQFRETFKELFLGRMVEPHSRYSIVNGPRSCSNTNETVL
ncbi:G protein-coupled sex peptide receptor [Musca autumnalis]|uniref:G protein-coupled sex peptide receptor n=1 Tax=Musca autumnalis TaxID=221902 RepID=UPI003CE9584F